MRWELSWIGHWLAVRTGIRDATVAPTGGISLRPLEERVRAQSFALSPAPLRTSAQQA